MQIIAIATTTADRLGEIPGDFWLKLALGILALVVLTVVLRKIAGVNKVVLSVVVLFALAMVGFTWIYERNEPRWATPVVSWLGGFLPSKGAYATKQQTPPPAE